MESYLDVSVEAGLKGIDVDEVMRQTQVHPSCLPLLLFNCEGAILKTYLLGQSGTDVRKTTDQLRMLGVWIAIEETPKPTSNTRLLFTVAMKVNYGSHSLLLIQLRN